MSPTTPPRQYNVKQAADYLLLGKDAVYKLAATPKLTSRRKGPRNGRIYFLQQDLDDYLLGNGKRPSCAGNR